MEVEIFFNKEEWSGGKRLEREPDKHTLTLPF